MLRKNLNSNTITGQRGYKMDTRTISLISISSALIFAIALLNKFFLVSPMFGVSIAHVTIDAIFCTALFIVVMKISSRPGISTLIGFTTGLLMTFFGAKGPALVAWLLRGLVLDVIVFGFHRGRCKFSCYSLAASLAFFTQTFVGKVLYLLLFMPMKAWITLTSTLFIPLVLAGSLLSILGVYLAIGKIIPVIT